jgi:phage terminase small subunit
MAQRGRRGDPAAQQAKGFPGKRKSKVQKMVEEAERVASLLAHAPAESADAFAPPVFLNDPLVAPALKIWRDYAPELNRTLRLRPLHRLSFAMFCVYMGEWITASEDIRQNGKWQKVKTVSGGQMERTRPVVAFREIAYRNVMELSKEFGLTPREEYALFRDQADAVAKNPGLFGNQASRRDGDGAGEPGPERPVQGSLVGSLDSLDSPPPGSMN